MMMRMRGATRVLVVTPPSTYGAWQETAKEFGIEVTTISHAKFRMKDYLLSRHVPVIVDEFHMLGGHGGKGWKKLDTLARRLEAPLIICSATPNYNDAERVYCVAHVLDPHGNKGGYLEWLYKHCITEQNPFGMEPKVIGFHRYQNSIEFLAAMPGVYYLEDDLVYSIEDVPYDTPLPAEMESHSYNRRDHKMIASQMERRHTETFQRLVNESGFIQPHVLDAVLSIIDAGTGPVLIYANHATVARSLAASMVDYSWRVGLVTGESTTKVKAAVLDSFKKGGFPVLIGTASLATGTDGLDKMCDRLIILDDTDDDSLRRQLIGRIMPRGADTDASMKRVYRFLPV
jgi:superfamily II DNA or RNA helicase